MNVLVCAYCAVEPSGQLLIGTYKRALRVGMGLHARGHRVGMFAGGREYFSDDLTQRAHEAFYFVEADSPFANARKLSDSILQGIRRHRPDIVAIAEVPLGGPLLECALHAIDEGIPVVFLDNAYNPKFVEFFCQKHGALADGVVLTGLPACHAALREAYLCQTTPFLTPQAERARAILPRMQEGERLVTVLGYDDGVLAMAKNVLRGLADLPLRAVIVTRDAEAATRDMTMPVHVLPPPQDGTLFGLLQISDLVIGKSAFQQITESLALGTPFLGLFYETFFDPEILPPETYPYFHVTRRNGSVEETCAAARRLLARNGHAAPLPSAQAVDGIDQAIAFLEGLPRAPRTDTGPTCASLGFSGARLQQALGSAAPPSVVRCCRVRNMQARELYSVVAGEPGALRRLWGSRFHSVEALRADLAAPDDLGRRVRFVSEDPPLVLEDDLGYDALPALGLD